MGLDFFFSSRHLLYPFFYDNTEKFAEVLAIYKSMYRWYLVVAFSDKKQTNHVFSPDITTWCFCWQQRWCSAKSLGLPGSQTESLIKKPGYWPASNRRKKKKKNPAPLLDPKLVNGWRAGYTTSPPLRLAASLSQWWVTTGDSRYQS